MNKAELIAQLSPRVGGRRRAAEAIDGLIDIVIREVASGGTVAIKGFGSFETAVRAPRTGRNPVTGEQIPIPSIRMPQFRPGAHFRDAVNEPAQVPTQGPADGRATPQKGSRRKRGRSA